MPKILSAKDFRSMSWKNGGGVTRELYRLPHPRDPERFLLRLSMAQVTADGPFSTFPGIDRTLLLIKGEGLRLHFPDQLEVVLDQPLLPLAFAGEDAIDCHLVAGPCHDFNVMIDREFGDAKTQLSQATAFTADNLRFVLDFQRDVLVVLKAGESWSRKESTTVIVVDVAEKI
jgi:environmental stress-induced protein Ves